MDDVAKFYQNTKKKGGGNLEDTRSFLDFRIFVDPPDLSKASKYKKNRSCAAHRLQISRRSAYHHPTVFWVLECFLRDVCHS